MMIGTPTASSLWPAYLLTVFSVVAGFAVYDILYRRVPDRALAFFMPFAALAPLLKVCLTRPKPTLMQRFSKHSA